VKIRLLDDASTFVKDSISDVLHEMLAAGALVGLIVLLLLGSWRATVIVWASILLSILTAIAERSSRRLHVVHSALRASSDSAPCSSGSRLDPRALKVFLML
jgi:AcrB/AcrD/AcrF family protein